MNSEKWDEICFILSENIKPDISERDFENNVIQALNVLGWKSFSGNIQIRPSIKIGSSNRITPDFVIKSDEGKKVFVIEIKAPNLPLSSNFQQQLFSYMRQLKLEYGLLIGEKIQIYYDGASSDEEYPILLENIEFKRKTPKGNKFVDIFNKSNFNPEELEEYRKNSLEKINWKKDLEKLKVKILSNHFKEKINELIKQELLSDYDGKMIEEVLSNVQIFIEERNKFIESKSKNFSTDRINSSSKLGVIASIKSIITTIPKSKDEIFQELIKLFPEREKSGMKITVNAQLGNTQPTRIERERHFKLILTTKGGQIKYSIEKPIDYNTILPIELIPNRELEFKTRLLNSKRAYIKIIYENNFIEIKQWNANRFVESSGVLVNLRSRKEFRKGNWQGKGIVKVIVSIFPFN